MRAMLPEPLLQDLTCSARGHGRHDGVKFGRQLMAGGVLEHVSQEHNFYDNSKFFYRFPRDVLALDRDMADSDNEGEGAADSEESD